MNCYGLIPSDPYQSFLNTGILLKLFYIFLNTFKAKSKKFFGQNLFKKTNILNGD